tara:strand:- start:347 stop:1030 length:684 start_codon:yes stop_codon:yes gene_type:complete
MKKIILIGALFASSLGFSQYCMFFDFKTDNPEAVVTTISKMMNTEWGKNIQGTKSLFGYFFNGDYEATHTMQFCFQDEAGVADFMSSWSASTEVQQLGKELDEYVTDVSQALNTPVWYQNDWSNDQVFMIYQMDVKNPTAYVSEYASFSKKMSEKIGINNSYGVGYPILGKTDDYSHFVWIGAPDIQTALSRNKQMTSDALFREFSAKVADLREVVNVMMMMRLMNF